MNSYVLPSSTNSPKSSAQASPSNPAMDSYVQPTASSGSAAMDSYRQPTASTGYPAMRSYNQSSGAPSPVKIAHAQPSPQHAGVNPYAQAKSPSAMNSFNKPAAAPNNSSIPAPSSNPAMNSYTQPSAANAHMNSYMQSGTSTPAAMNSYVQPSQSPSMNSYTAPGY